MYKFLKLKSSLLFQIIIVQKTTNHTLTIIEDHKIRTKVIDRKKH